MTGTVLGAAALWSSVPSCWVRMRRVWTAGRGCQHPGASPHINPCHPAGILSVCAGGMGPHLSDVWVRNSNLCVFCTGYLTVKLWDDLYLYELGELRSSVF